MKRDYIVGYPSVSIEEDPKRTRVLEGQVDGSWADSPSVFDEEFLRY